MVIAANIIDVFIVILLMLAVPTLAAIYLQGRGGSRSLTTKVCVFGMLWMVYALVSEELLEAVFRFERADSYAHESMAELLMQGKDPHFFDKIPTGNKAYQTFVYALFLLGAYVPSARTINAFTAFWGGLILASYLKDYVVFENRRDWMLLAVIFFPSTVFWSSGNMKEGLTYWGICMMYTAAFSGTQERIVTPGLIVGTLVCGFMRPHMAFAWLIAIGSVTMMSRGRRVYALIALAALPLLFSKMQTLAQNDFSSLDTTLAMLKSHGEGLKRLGGSVHSGTEIPVISGLLAIFLRPFLWESRSLFMLICALEIWTLTITMVRSWWRATSAERRFLLRTPAIRVALFAVLITSVLFSYLPNDGLLARQRVQIVPALMILAIMPLGVGSFLRNTRRNSAFGAPPLGYPTRRVHRRYQEPQCNPDHQPFLGADGSPRPPR